jgi:hypothetical protein
MKLISMIISICLVGITLGSLGIAYHSYQQELVTIKLEADNIVQKYVESPDPWDGAFDDPEGERIESAEKAFQNVITIHGIIIFFIILSEIGLLIVLPKTSHNKVGKENTKV